MPTVSKIRLPFLNNINQLPSSWSIECTIICEWCTGIKAVMVYFNNAREELYLCCTCMPYWRAHGQLQCKLHRLELPRACTSKLTTCVVRNHSKYSYTLRDQNNSSNTYVTKEAQQTNTITRWTYIWGNKRSVHVDIESIVYRKGVLNYSARRKCDVCKQKRKLWN
jgi:hypothetical protein